MIIRGSRKLSLIIIAVSIALGIPLTTALVGNSSTIEAGWRWLAWVFVALSALILIRGLQLLTMAPVVLETTSEGINIHYKSGTRGVTKDADLLPWRLIDSMRLIRVHSKDNSFNWAIELVLTAPPPFDASKRDPLQWSIFGQCDPNRFHIDTFVLNISKEEALAALESGWHKWQKSNKHSVVKLE